MNKKTIIIIGLIILAIIFVVFYFYSKPAPTASAKYDDFAKCLASKNITMYGAAWCSHCQNEKKAFEGSFKYVPYVECPDDPKKCLDKNVNAYPTWIFPDGKKLVGEQGLEKLSQESGCPLPPK
jgi:hypothetical protein